MKLKIIVGALCASVVVASFFVHNNASAVSGSCYFTENVGEIGSTSGCSESGLGSYGINDVLRKDGNNRDTDGSGHAIPKNVNNKQEFINLITDYFSSGSRQNKIGAAFIMQTMRGERTWPRPSDRDNWIDRINSDRVTVKRVWDPKVGKTSWYDNDKNNTFFADHPNVGRWVIEVRYNGDLYAQIEYDCGNMVANYKILPYWDTAAKTTVNGSAGDVTVAPNDLIKWHHTVTNNGPNATSDAINWRIKSNYGYLDNGLWGSGRPKNDVLVRDRTRPTVAGEVGNKYCQWITASPGNSEGSTVSSEKRCATVVADYVLTPIISVNPSGIIEDGGVTDVIGTVEKSGAGSSRPSQWQLSKIVVQPGKIIQTIAGNSAPGVTPSQYFKNGANNNAWEDKGSGTNVTFSVASTLMKNLNNEVITGYSVGTKICFALSVQPRTGTIDEWRHSAPMCVIVGKKPKLQITGGDLWARSKIDTSTSVIGGVGAAKVFGSWVEFSAFSIKDNVGLASGAGLRNGNGTINQSGWSALTFANILPNPPPSDSSSAFGNYSSGLPDAPKIAEHFSSRPSTNIAANSIDASTLSPTKVNTRAGDLIITRSNFPRGKSVVIIVSGTITIADNITYTDGPFNSFADIPQLVIIAKNIIIKDAVTQVDAWLVARGNGVIKGTIKTCENPAKSSTVCNLKLTINGPVLTDTLYLYRTAGSDASPNTGNPAEVFNLRPDAYLWAYQQGLGSTLPTTAATTELPPRF